MKTLQERRQIRPTDILFIQSLWLLTLEGRPVHQKINSKLCKSCMHNGLICTTDLLQIAPTKVSASWKLKSKKIQSCWINTFVYIVVVLFTAMLSNCASVNVRRLARRIVTDWVVQKDHPSAAATQQSVSAVHVLFPSDVPRPQSTTAAHDTRYVNVHSSTLSQYLINKKAVTSMTYYTVTDKPNWNSTFRRGPNWSWVSAICNHYGDIAAWSRKLLKVFDQNLPLWKKDSFWEDFQNFVPKGFITSQIHVLCANFVKF